MREIGSEFWLENISGKKKRGIEDEFSFGEDMQLLFSGRTAISYVIKDIKTSIKSVYMPNYCCSSMLQPFTENNIVIEFYDVTFNEDGIKYNIDYSKEIDAFFAMSYFGFENNYVEVAIEKFKSKGTLIIEDITHRLLSETNHCRKSDYLIASLRKWFPIPSGGLAVKKNGLFNKTILKDSAELVSDKVEAMILKADYIKRIKLGEKVYLSEKQNFLKLFSSFNNQLNLNYNNFEIDKLSKRILDETNVDYVRQKRRSNSEVLYKTLKNLHGIDFLIKEPDFKQDCPLFLPIIVNANKRKIIRDELNEEKIFCPIHWPKPVILSEQDSKQLYESELSLIVDQRYNHSDMKYLARRLEQCDENF